MTNWQALDLVWDILLAIAVPSVLFALGGRWLDQRWHTTPLFLILGLLAALGITTLLVIRKAKKLQALMKDQNNKK